MSLSRLKQTLLNKIQFYLDHDNPMPQNDGGFIDDIFNNIYAVFKSEGRKRAETYRDIIIAYQNESDLVRGVFNDLQKSTGSRLESSTDLRKRILEGLCDFFNISLDAVEVQPPMHFGPGATFAGAGLFIGQHYYNENQKMQRNQMRVLREKVNMFLRGENAPSEDELYRPRGRALGSSSS